MRTTLPILLLSALTATTSLAQNNSFGLNINKDEFETNSARAHSTFGLTPLSTLFLMADYNNPANLGTSESAYARLNSPEKLLTGLEFGLRYEDSGLSTELTRVLAGVSHKSDLFNSNVRFRVGNPQTTELTTRDMGNNMYSRTSVDTDETFSEISAGLAKSFSYDGWNITPRVGISRTNFEQDLGITTTINSDDVEVSSSEFNTYIRSDVDMESYSLRANSSFASLFGSYTNLDINGAPIDIYSVSALGKSSNAYLLGGLTRSFDYTDSPSSSFFAGLGIHNQDLAFNANHNWTDNGNYSGRVRFDVRPDATDIGNARQNYEQGLVDINTSLTDGSMSEESAKVERRELENNLRGTNFASSGFRLEGDYRHSETFGNEGTALLYKNIDLDWALGLGYHQHFNPQIGDSEQGLAVGFEARFGTNSSIDLRTNFNGSEVGSFRFTYTNGF